MNYKLVGIITLIAFMFLFNFVYAKDKAFPLIGKVIYLDPGHGGKDSGAFYKNVKESTLNLDISNKTLKKYESMYGPLCTDSEYAASNKWNWDNSPWPWEGK